MAGLDNLWVMRYKAGIKGATQGFIQASDEITAMEVGAIYCEKHSGHRFISVERPILADESILEKEAEKTELDISSMGVVEAMRLVKEGRLDAEAALEAETKGESRRTLVEYLKKATLGQSQETLPGGTS